MEKEHIKTLITSSSKEISSLYYLNRDAFFNFGKKYGLDYNDLSDIYQEAFIALRKHALNGKLDKVNSSLKTYLFGIGKYMIFDVLKEKKKTDTLNPSVHISNDLIDPVPIENESEELSLEQKLLNTFFKKLGKKCREMLILFYSRGLSVEEIAEYTNYTNSSVVRSQKSRCIKKLREMIKS
jgi:RNA polymerase sigma factor (sigma-70 family)